MPSPLIGRARELADASAMLRAPETRLLTVSGPPGVGKTRLALAVAETLAGSFEHGVAVVPLEDVASPELVPAAIARVLALSEGDARPTAELVRAALRSSHRLLLLDTFEHLLPSAAWLAVLLGDCPEIKLLVSSRAALRIRWETEFPLSPLAVQTSGELEARSAPADGAQPEAPAVELFVRRARAVVPRLIVTPESRAAVAEICRRLDGLPLAIELAAARCAVLPPQAILERLDAGLALVANGAGDLPARQRGLRAAIEWSHALLPANEQRLLRRLAVFAGGFAPDAAESMAAEAGDVGPEPLEHIAALVRHSLLVSETREGGTRLRLLGTVRAFALEQLEAHDDEAHVRDWHARYYLGLARDAGATLGGPEQLGGLARLDAEQDNIRAALEWTLRCGDAEASLAICAAMWRFWRLRGQLSEGRSALERALRRGSASPEARTEVLLGLGALLVAQGDGEAARAPLEEALAIRRGLGERAGIAAVLQELGNLGVRHGDYAGARTMYEHSLASAREAGDRWTAAASMIGLGVALRRLGDGAAAQTLFEEGLPLARSLGDRRLVAFALTNLGNAARDRGENDQARILHEESLALWRTVGSRSAIAASLSHLAATDRRRNDLAAARRASAESLALVRDLGDVSGTAVNIAALAAAAAADGRAEQAARLFGAAEAMLRGVGAGTLLAASAEFSAAIASVQAALGDSWERSRRAGSLLSPEQAIGEALAVGDAAAPPSAQTPILTPLLAVALSRREREVLRLLVEGLTNREMAERLVLSIRTVESHVFNIYAKIGARGRADATAYALRHGLA